MLPIEQDVLEIEHFDTGGSNALSLYLDTDPSRGPGRNLEAQLNDALRDEGSLHAGEGVEADIRSAAKTALDRIAALEPFPRAVAAFVCPAKGFVRVVPLPEPTDRTAYWGPELRLRPLLAALDEHERTVVALVDQEHARIFRVFLGQIEEAESMELHDSGHAQAGRVQRKSRGPGVVAAWMGYGERNLQRRHEWHVRRHLQTALEAMRVNGDRLLVAGVDETAHELWRLLPKRVLHRAMLVKGISVDAPVSEVLERVLEAQRQLEREVEEELVDALIERDRARSVFGGPAVAEAVSDARVHTLVIAADAKMGGAECQECGWLVVDTSHGNCPRCGGALAAHADLLDRLTWRVISSGGRVEEVRGPAAGLLRARGGLGALLRYVPK